MHKFIKVFLIVSFAGTGFVFVAWLIHLKSEDGQLKSDASSGPFAQSLGSSSKYAQESDAPDPRIGARTPVGYVDFGTEYQPLRIDVLTEPDRLSMDVSIIIGAEIRSNRERFSALRRLDGLALPDEEALRLLSYLGDRNRDQSMSDAAMYVLINELVALFHNNPQLDDRYLEISRDLIQDAREKEVIRDYALQGLSHAYQHATGEQASYIRQVFWDALSQTETSLAGTSLLALNRIHERASLTKQEIEDFEQVAVHYVRNARFSERVRIPAIQVCAAIATVNLGGDLEAILRSDASTISEKGAALSALRRLDPEAFRSAQTIAIVGNHRLLQRVSMNLSKAR